MKKVFFLVTLILLLLIGVWGTSTYWFGLKAEDQYRMFLQQASQFQHFKLSNESYSRGFLASSARTLVDFQLPPGVAGGTQRMRLVLVHDIIHGPFPVWRSPAGGWQFRPVMAIIETGLQLSPETQNQLASLYAQIPELASIRDYTVIALDGSGEENLLIPAFRHTLGNGEKVAVDWKGLSLRVNFTVDLRGYSGTLSIPGLEVIGNTFQLKANGLNSSFNSHQGLSGFWLGEASFDISHLELADNNEEEPYDFLIRGLKASSSSKPSGDNVNITVTLRTDQVKLDETKSGSGVFEMELRNLDAASLAKLEETVRSQQTLTTEEPSEAVQMMMLARYMEILPALLKKSPEIEIRQLELKTTDGDFAGKARIAFDGSKPEATQNLLTLANAITAQAEFKVADRLLRRVATDLLTDKIAEEWDEEDEEAPGEEELIATAAARVDEQLTSLQEQGIIVREDGNYRASLRYEAGQVVLNGRPLSLKDLVQ
jgi:uncharacterized protein YdgA (DUF945 family)